MTEAEITFLRESNAIEDVWDDESLEKAKLAWEYLSPQKDLNFETILTTHKILSEGGLPDFLCGHWRNHDVCVGYYIAPGWQLVPHLMQNWIFESTQSNPPLDPLLLHARFEKIHPFSDYNGRIGRLLLNWQRLRYGLPIMIIYEKDKQKYYDLFRGELTI